jgi:hypothetical protein
MDQEADAVSDFPSHEIGEPCPVIALAYGHFGEKLGDYLLWEFTCFPCSDADAWEQLRALVAADRVGLLDEYLASERAKQDRAMEDAADAWIVRDRMEGLA